MHPIDEYKLNITRRYLFQKGSHVLGSAALASLMGNSAFGFTEAPDLGKELTKTIGKNAAMNAIHFPSKVKNVIYMHMVGGPSQMDLYDYKPKMKDFYDVELPKEIAGNQRKTTMTSGQSRFPIAPSKYKFQQHGESGMWVTELLPHTAKMTDQLCFIRSMYTEAINHEPAMSYMQTGNQVTGRPCMGSWLSYGLGSLNENLPTFVVMVAQPSNTEQLQAISGRLWSAGFLPGEHSGVAFRSAGDPILYIDNPPGVSTEVRRKTLDGLNKLNQVTLDQWADPETRIRIKQYEMAFKMQASVPELTDLSKETESTLSLYGDAVKKPGSFANTTLMARRMVERGVRFVQIYHNNWDHHSNVGGRMPDQCKDIDQPCYGLIQDLKARGLLDSTLIIWGGEFGRTIYTQGKLSHNNYGRDHHPRCFTMWMAGGGVKQGMIHGETDDFSYNIVKDGVHIRDLHATILRLLGIDHEQFSYKNNGLDARLTGVVPAKIIKELLA